MTARWPLLIAAWLCVFSTPALAERLITSLSASQVLITSNYLGSELVLFGSIERDRASASRAGGYNLLVTARGPRSSITVREKDRAGVIFVNQDRRKFTDIPIYLAVLGSKPVREMADEDLRMKLKMGLDGNIPRLDALTSQFDPDIKVFRNALIRLKTEQGLFRENDRGVTFLSDNLFRAVIELPATAPPGNYDVEVRLFADGTPLAEATSPFEVKKVGFEAVVAAAARSRPILYGVAVVALALASGWLASVAFRRD